MERANQEYFWDSVCFKITLAKDGADYDLITQYNKLSEIDVITHAKVIWGRVTSFEFSFIFNQTY